MTQIFSVLNPSLQVFIIALFALIFGSFASLITHRTRREKHTNAVKNTGTKIVFARSKCPNCGVILKIKNLIPLFSWLWQRGKCSNCHSKISARYPLIELSFLISFLVIFFTLNQQLDWKMLIYFAIAGTLISMTAFDLEQYFIPNKAQYFLVILVLTFLGLEGGVKAISANIPSAFLYLGFGFAISWFFYSVTKIEGIGIDDLKFFFIAGLLLGTNDLLLFMILSGLFGMCFGILWQKIKQDSTFPFAPAICLSLFLCLLLNYQVNPTEWLEKLLFLQKF